jgi:hypothetical protein
MLKLRYGHQKEKNIMFPVKNKNLIILDLQNVIFNIEKIITKLFTSRKKLCFLLKKHKNNA